MRNTFEYAWINRVLNVRILNKSDAVHWKLEKHHLLYHSQKHHLKAFCSHLQSLALPSQTLIFT